MRRRFIINFGTLICFLVSVGFVLGVERIGGLKLFVRQDRMYQVTGDEIASNGINIARADASSINLYNQGRAVPIAIENTSPEGRLQAGSVITFWGEFPRGAETHHDLFTRENAYILEFESADPSNRFVKTQPLPRPAPGASLTTSFKRTEHIEEDNLLAHYQFFHGRPTDRVMWKDFKSPPRIAKNKKVAFKLPGFVPGDSPVAMRVLLWGTSDLMLKPDHDWALVLNGHEIGSAQWDANTSIVFEAAGLQGAFFSSGYNTLEFQDRLAGDSIDAMLLDWIEVDYTSSLAPSADFLEYTFPSGASSRNIRLDAGFSASPIRIFHREAAAELNVEAVPNEKEVGARASEYAYEFPGDKGTFRAVGPRGFLKPERIGAYSGDNLAKSATPAQYIVIAHHDFMEAVEPLAARRRAQGLSSLVVDVEDVYNAYSFGRFNPDSIRRFLNGMFESAAEGGKEIRYVFLVGDATYDYLGVKNETPNFVPTHHSDGEGELDLPVGNPTYALDDYFAYGKGEGKVPRAAVGRLPASTPAQVKAYVAKVIEYEDASPPSVATSAKTSDKRAVLIAATGFDSYCKELTGDKLLADWNRDLILATSDRAANAAVPTRIVDSINAGCDLLYFVGHGAHFLWRTGTEINIQDTDVFTPANVESLKNKGRYPIVFTATCFSALFDAPVHPFSRRDTGVGVCFVESAGKGAIALVASDTKITPGSGDHFTREVVTVLEAGNSTTRLGDAYLKAKQTCAKDIYTPGIALIGDPALLVGSKFAVPAAP